jgi:hypothetical protein
MAAVLLLGVGSLNGCMCGGGSDTSVQTTTKSCGEELTDLKTAFDSKAIDQKEYDRLRNEVLKRCD